jgi:hypothetical protein
MATPGVMAHQTQGGGSPARSGPDATQLQIPCVAMCAYVRICNVGSHYLKGMRKDFTVK